VENLRDKHLFNEVAVKYDKRRPKYVPVLFDDIKEYANITEAKSVLEVGCGTGLATEPFLKTGCRLIAIELGDNLAAYTREKFKDYANLEVVHCAFEDYAGETDFDMVYSATAFHWIPPEVGYQKAYDLLKPGGTLGLFWNRPAVNSEDPLHQRIQLVYREFLPEWTQRKARNDYNSKYETVKKQIAQTGFIDLKFKLYHDTRTMTGIEYVELLDTYSDHRALPDSIRTPFYRSIQKAIEEFGNQLTILDTIDLYLARRP